MASLVFVNCLHWSRLTCRRISNGPSLTVRGRSRQHAGGGHGGHDLVLTDMASFLGPDLVESNPAVLLATPMLRWLVFRFSIRTISWNTHK